MFQFWMGIPLFQDELINCVSYWSIYWSWIYRFRPWDNSRLAFNIFCTCIFKDEPVGWISFFSTCIYWPSRLCLNPWDSPRLALFSLCMDIAHSRASTVRMMCSPLPVQKAETTVTVSHGITDIRQRIKNKIPCMYRSIQI